MSASEKRNVFMFPSTRSLRLELGLLAMPVIAIIAAVSLLHVQPDRRDHDGKVKLRVVTAVEPANPELAREAVQRSELIQFALSKVAKVPETAPAAGEETAAERIVVATLLPAAVEEEAHTVVLPVATKTVRPRRKTARKPIDIRPGKLRTAVRKRKLPLKQTAAKRRGPTQARGNWLTASMQWPVNMASKTFAPVKKTFVPVRKSLLQTVDQAGNALETLKKKIL